ncbi:SpoIIE family protein phosphatase [Rhodocytophaga aerolata]
MASTLSIFVWPIGQACCYLANIGDSRIYSSYQGQLQLLTKDDAIMFKERVLMHGGVRIIDKYMLSKVIGMSNLQISVTEKPLREEEIIILATDGFYDARKSIYTQTMAGLSLQQHLEESFQETVKKFEILRGDDFTVVMIKKRKHSR